MVVYTFFHCSYAACPTANDLIQVAMSEDGSTNYDKKLEIRTSDNRIDKDWVREEFTFEVGTARIFVCICSYLFTKL